MKKFAGATILLLTFCWTSPALAAGEEAYTFGQALQGLVRQQQERTENNQGKENLYYLPARPREDKPANKKTESWTMTKDGPS